MLIVLIFLNIVWQRKVLKMRPHYAHQPEHTLPHPPEVCWKPLKYGYLHITDTQLVPTLAALEGLHSILHRFEVLCEDWGTLDVSYGESEIHRKVCDSAVYQTGVDKTTVNIHCTCNNNFTCDCVPWPLTSDLPGAMMRSWTFHWRCRRLWGTFIAECSWSSCACPHTRSPLWVTWFVDCMTYMSIMGAGSVGATVYKYHLITLFVHEYKWDMHFC